MVSGTIIELLVALGVGGVLAKLVDGLVDWFKGRHNKEQTCWEQRDREARKRRVTEEYAHELRRLLISEGIPSIDIPPWP